LAEIGTNITEFGTLSRLTGDGRNYAASKRALGAVFDRRSPLDLVGTTLNVETGAWTDRDTTINPPVDSYYEYLWDGWDLFGDADLLAWYRTHTEAILRRQAIEIDGRLWFNTVDYESGVETSREQSELASFYAGLLGQSSYRREGRRYLRSWGAALRRFPILPEGLDPETFAATQVGNQLRPEYVDSAFNLWLTDQQDRWIDLAADYYERMKRTSRGGERLHDPDGCDDGSAATGRPDLRLLVLREHEVLLADVRPRSPFRLPKQLPQHRGQHLPRPALSEAGVRTKGRQRPRSSQPRLVQDDFVRGEDHTADEGTRIRFEDRLTFEGIRMHDAAPSARSATTRFGELSPHATRGHAWMCPS
jgi:Glycosyl hydrolase family 47